MKYRRLSNDELAQLELQFIRFLSAQSITGEDWKKTKENDPQRAEELIGQFSDIVIEKTLHNVQYLEYKEPRDIKTFHCQDDKITMRGLFAEGGDGLDFTGEMSPAEMNEVMKNSGATLKVYTAEKGYKDGDRLAEIFKMLESGCKISPDGALYKSFGVMVGGE